MNDTMNDTESCGTGGEDLLRSTWPIGTAVWKRVRIEHRAGHFEGLVLGLWRTGS